MKQQNTIRQRKVKKGGETVVPCQNQAENGLNFYSPKSERLFFFFSESIK